MILVMFGALLFEMARPYMIVFSVLIVFVLTGLLTPQEAFNGFSNQGMLTIALLFVVAGTIQKYGVLEKLMVRWLDQSQSVKHAMFRFFFPASLSSAFLNNTPIVVTFTPMIKNWCEERGIAPSKFLIPLSYVTILGGTITLMGTSTNLVIHGMLLDRELTGFSIFQLAVVGIPIMIIGFIYLFTIGNKLLPGHKGFSERIKEETREYIAEMVVLSSFHGVNQTVADAGLRELKGLYLIEIIRGEDRLSPVKSQTIIEEGDRLIFTGLMSTIAELQQIKGLELQTGSNLDLEDLKDGGVQLVEAVVSHQSSLLSKTIKQSQFRSQFDAGVLAVHRNNERIQSKIGDIILKPGDVLLLLAGSDFVKRYSNSNNFYIVSSLETPKDLNGNPRKGWLSIAVLLLMIMSVTLGFLTMFKAMLLTVFIYVITKLVTPEEAKGYIQFNVLLLIASAFGVGEAMTQTGLASWLANGLLVIGEPLGILVLLAAVYILTNIFTELITNSAAAVLMLPIGLEMASTLGVDYMGFAVIIAIAASASFITPIGYQTNLIVYGPGGYHFKDYIKVGTPLALLVMITTVTIVNFVWF